MSGLFFKSLAGQTFWEIAGKACRFLAIILVARFLGASGFGTFILVVTFVEIMNVIADFKLEPGMVRQVTLGKISEKTAFSNGLAIKVIAGLVVLCFSFPLFLLFDHSYEGLIHLACTAIALLLWQITSFTRTIFQIHGVLEKFSMTRAVAGIFFLCSVLGLMLCGTASVPLFLMCYGALFIVESLMALWLCSYFVPVKLALDFRVVREMAAEGLFFSVMNAFVVFYYKIDTLLIEVFRGKEVLGLYNAAYRLLDVSMFVPMAVAAMIYPEMLRRSSKEPAGWGSGQRAMDILVGFAVPFAVLLFCARNAVVELTYGAEFWLTARFLGILCLSMIFLYPAAILCQALIVAGQDRRLMLIHASTAVGSIFLYWFAIGKFGPEGAAWATVFLQAMVFMASFYFTRQAGADIEVSSFPKALLMSCPILITAYAVDDKNWGAVITLAALVTASLPAFTLLFLKTLKDWRGVSA